MRVAVVSDIHGSRAASTASVMDLRKTSPDVVLHGGDLAVNGPDPDGVVSVFREQGWSGAVGNTDEMLWRLEDLPRQLQGMPKLESLLRVMYEHTAPAARERLSSENLQWLQRSPTSVEHEHIRLVHARPHDLWRAPAPDVPDEELAAAYEGAQERVVIYGHIHRPFVRTARGTTFANSGSIGLAWDGNPHASYLAIDDCSVPIRRLDYDVDRDVRALRDSKMPCAAWFEYTHQ